MTSRENSLERALEDAVSRALRDNLAPLQRTANELHQAYADLVAACASARPSNALPAMLRAQTAAAALAAGLSVLSNFVAVALNPRDADGSAAAATAVVEEEPSEAVESQAAGPARHEIAQDWGAHEAEAIGEPTPAPMAHPEPGELEPELAVEPLVAAAEETHASVELAAEPSPEPTPQPAHDPSAAEVAVFDLASLPSEMQDLHRRANRVAKVAMQDIKLLRPKDVQAGREHRDLCERLRVDLDKARKEYDRRFRAISDHPVDYFHHWMLEILAGGDSSALGEYPYPSNVLRH